MNRPPPDYRNVVIDNARGMAILLVILGHVPGLASDLSKWIFSFHVPLFFIIAGMSAPAYPLPLTAYSKKLARNLLIPFICFWLFSYGYWLPTHRLGGNAAMYADYTVATPWIGLLIATGNRMPMNPALWFFTALFFVAIFFQLLLRIQNEKSRVAVAFLVSFAAIMASTITKQSYFWNIDIALSCLFFYLLGAAGRPATNRLDLLRPNAIYLGLMIIVTFASSVQFSSNNSGIDINNRIYGASEWVFLFNAILGSLAMFLLAKLIPRNFFLTFISKNSLPLFAVYMVAFRVLTAILIAGFGFARADIEGIFFLILYFSWAFVFALPIIYLGRKYIPFALGVKTPAAHNALYMKKNRASIAKE